MRGNRTRRFYITRILTPETIQHGAAPSGLRSGQWRRSGEAAGGRRRGGGLLCSKVRSSYGREALGAPRVGSHPRTCARALVRPYEERTLLHKGHHRVADRLLLLRRAASRTSYCT